MGKLARIELFNFKSYKGHQVIDLGDSFFTSIIGPNGSGKSNSMDAISFVLGIKSSQLRSSHMRDLVYRGRVLKHSKVDGVVAANGDDVEDMDMSASQGDPKTAWVMAVYVDDDEKEQYWKRSITSQGSSEYRINGKVVTAQEYNAALEKENILIKARNFLVFQGDVEAVASQSPRDLTRLIEQISGSLEYKQEYEELKVEQEKTADQLNNAIIRRRGLNAEHKQYLEQKKEVENYQKKTAERDQAIITHVLWRLFHFQQTMEENKQEIEKQQIALRECKRIHEEADGKLDEVKRSHAKTARAVNKQEKHIKDKENEIKEKNNTLEPIDEKIKQAKHHQKTREQRLLEITRNLEKQRGTVDDLKKDLKVAEKARDKFEDQQAKLADQVGSALSAKDQAEYNRLRSQVETRTANEAIKVGNIERQLQTDNQSAEAIRKKLEVHERQLAKSETDVSNLTESYKAHKVQHDNAYKELDYKKKELKKLGDDRRKRHAEMNSLNEKLQQTIRKLSEMEDGQNQSRKETQIKESVAHLKRLLPGVKGRIAELCKAKQKKYKLAVSTVLGRNFDTVVVDNEKTAKECIQWLKESRAGRMTFIPLDTIQVKPINSSLKGMHRDMRMAIDTIEYDNSVERAMQYACGNAVVCDNINVAKFICYEKGVEVKAVTLEGTIIHKGGNMTGGKVDDKRGHWDDSEIEGLRKIKQDTQDRLEKLANLESASGEDALAAGVELLNRQLEASRDERDALKRNLDDKKKECDYLSQQVSQFRPQLAQAEQSLAQLQAQLEEAREVVSQVEDELFQAFCQRLQLPNIREYEKQQGALQAEAAQKRLEFETHISRYQNLLVPEKDQLQNLQQRVDKFKKEIERDKNTIKDLEETMAVVTEERDNLNDELEALKEEQGEKEQELIGIQETMATHKKDVANKHKQLEVVQRKIGELEAEVELMSTRKYDLLRKCKLDGIEVPLAEDSAPLDNLPIDADAIAPQDDPDAMDVDEDPNAATNGATEIKDYGIKPDFDELDDDLQKNHKDEKVGEQLQDKIRAYDNELEKMAPNMKAIDRLEGVENRLQDVDKEYETAKRNARTAKEDFINVKEARFQKFNDAFKHISEQIGKVYKDLTKSQAFPLGGSAHLDMEDGDEPYLDGIRYTAMPPMKRFRDMEHLSGGEKTMAALALLFAVHSYQASPFFVLDEVDAALDNANVQKIAKYISEKASPGFQFIVISLKTALFQQSEALVGIYRDQVENSSKCLTLDLRNYVPA